MPKNLEQHGDDPESGAAEPCSPPDAAGVQGRSSAANLPSVSVVLATFNGARTLDACLAGLFCQDYPSGLLEVIAVDGGSADATLAILDRFPVRRLHNALRLAEGPGMGKAQGTLAATGELIAYVDQDNVIADPRWLRKLLRPLAEDPEIVAVQSLLEIHAKDSVTNRYLSLIGIEDPFALPRSLTSQALLHPGRFERRGDHLVCALSPDRVLYAGNNGCLWRRGALEDLGGYTQDTDMFALLAERRAKVAVSLSARLHHATSASFGHFLKKRAYYASVSMMRGAEARPFEWLPAGRWRHARFALQVAGNLVPLPHAITAVVRACRERRALWLFHPVAMAAVTWTYVFVACGSWRRLKSALVKLATNGLPGRRGSASHG